MASSICIAYIVKPEKFWEKQKASVGSSKYKFEVCVRSLPLFIVRSLLLLELACIDLIDVSCIDDDAIC